MNVIRPSEISVFDNLYCKPSQLGLPSNARFSMSIIFCVNGTLYDGQYDFTTGIWSTIPGDEKKREFPDSVVQYWFYPPGSIEVFQNYAKDVEKGYCSDSVSRLYPYCPDQKEESCKEIPQR